jgi:hypothetical protein
MRPPVLAAFVADMDNAIDGALSNAAAP